MKRALSCLILGSVLAGSSAVGAQTFSEATDVVVVEVPVQVIGADGKPVRGLTADNFAVHEGRAEQPLVGFEVLDLQSAPAAGPRSAPPMAARRHFLLLFDLSSASPKGVVQARAAAKDLVGQLHPSDLVSVASYSAAEGSRILLSFTGDRGQILAAVDRLSPPQLRADERPPDPLGLIAIPELLATVGKSTNQTPSEASSGQVDGSEMEKVIGQHLTQQAQLTQVRAAAATRRAPTTSRARSRRPSWPARPC